MGWLDLTEDLTAKGRKTFRPGMVLIFTDKRGIKSYVKIMRNYKGKVWGKLNYLYHPDEVVIEDSSEEKLKK
ncbi:MAG: hypothetical protein U1C12_00165 [Patescibacteria group bacterium]|nr:hypothetical protein [Patescibacteria group bacterium]